jgi:type 1 glutamine amidotransferase
MRAVAILLLFGACGDNVDQTDVVLYSRTLGYRHADAIDAALDVLPDKLRSLGFTVSATEVPEDLENLERTDVVVFLYTTGNNILETEGKRELERFVRADGGWVGIHSAADTEYEWPFYQDLVVGHFASHPEIQPASIDVVNTAHPAMAGVPVRWDAEDEWYNFLRDAGSVAGVTVLANLDETSYTGGDMGANHPIVWTHERFTGRVAYSGMGHVATRWQDDVYVDHVIAMIEWAATKMDPVNQ